MQTSFTFLDSAIKKGITVVALISVIFMVYPKLTLADTLRNPEDNGKLIFNIKLKNDQNQISNNLTIQEIDPNYQAKIILTQKLHDYLAEYNSPLADRASVLVDTDFKRIIAISYIESHMGLHQAYNNYSGIMTGSGKLKRYKDNVAWINDMNDLLGKHYPDQSFAQMNCRYVHPCSKTWVYSTNMIYKQLANLETEAKTLAVQKVTAVSPVASAVVTTQTN